MRSAIARRHSRQRSDSADVWGLGWDKGDTCAYCQSGHNKWSSEVGRRFSVQDPLPLAARRCCAYRATSAGGQARKTVGACLAKQLGRD